MLIGLSQGSARTDLQQPLAILMPPVKCVWSSPPLSPPGCTGGIPFAPLLERVKSQSVARGVFIMAMKKNQNPTSRDANRDPISGEPGAHPVGAGVGAAA